MPRKRITVTRKKQNETLPSWATEYVLMVQELERREVLCEFSKRFQVQRRDGYSSLDVLLFLLAYFCSGQKVGLRPFSRMCSGYERQLAAVGGRRCWPDQVSISRFLSSVSDEQLDELESWFLNEAVGGDLIEKHWSVICRDTHGEAWHVFDYDPTVTTLRIRALPEAEALPEPRRRAFEMAASGYPGRKRGDVQFSRATLQHAGSGQWLGASMSPGNGGHRRDIERAIDHIKELDTLEIDEHLARQKKNKKSLNQSWRKNLHGTFLSGGRHQRRTCLGNCGQPHQCLYRVN
jgi:hypothetical protein